MLKDNADVADFQMTSIAENPDTGDIAYGGSQSSVGNALLGLKKGIINDKDMPESWYWLIKETSISNGLI